MVIYCVANNCKNEQDKRKISFHRFPLKRPEILNLWVQAMHRENWSPSKSSRLCGEHFVPSDYVVKPGMVAKLKPDAVPSVFSFPKHLLPKNDVPRKRQIVKQDIQEIEPISEPMDINLDLPCLSTSHNKPVFVDCETQTRPDNRIEVLRRKVKTLNQKLKRKETKIRNMKDLIKEISRSNENLDAVLKNYFEGLPLELVLLQKESSMKVNPGQR